MPRRGEGTTMFMALLHTAVAAILAASSFTGWSWW